MNRQLLIPPLFAIFLVTTSGIAIHAQPIDGQQTANIRWAIAIHGGSSGDPTKLDEADRERRLRGLSRALSVGRDLLSRSAPAIDVVERVIRVMEDDPVFNAGRGAVLTTDGKAELDASIMDGKTLACGAVAGITKTKNPISLARRVMTETNHVLLAGPGADEFSIQQKVPQVPREYFLTEHSERPESYMGTVGCVVLDAEGNLAAGTSTGGTSKKLPGRIGDSPIVGAGTYAANGACAISGTGRGEEYIRNAVAYDIVAQMRYAGRTAEAATHRVMHSTLDKNIGGIIVVDHQGNIILDHNTPGMSCGAADSRGRFEVKLVANRNQPKRAPKK